MTNEKFKMKNAKRKMRITPWDDDSTAQCQKPYSFLELRCYGDLSTLFVHHNGQHIWPATEGAVFYIALLPAHREIYERLIFLPTSRAAKRMESVEPHNGR